jgi:hypothetical protein
LEESPVSRPPARANAARQRASRGYVSAIGALLSLALIAAAVAVVAYLVVRTPSATESAERLEPVGTAITAAELPAQAPTPTPTREPEIDPEAPAIAALPTAAAAPLESGPTPTPRLMSLPAAAETPTAAPTIPPIPASAPLAVALAPVDSAQLASVVPVTVAPPADVAAFAPDDSGGNTNPSDATAIEPAARGDAGPATALQEPLDSPEDTGSADNALQRALALRDDRGRASRHDRESESRTAPHSADDAPPVAPSLPATAPDLAVGVPAGSSQDVVGAGDPPAVNVPDANQIIDEVRARVKHP